MIRVLIISHCAYYGGAEKVLTQFLAEIKTFSAIVVAPEGKLFEELKKFNIPVIKSRTLGKLNKKDCYWSWPLIFILRWFGSQFEILYYILKFKPQIIQCNTMYAMIYGLLPAKICCRPLVWHMHDTVQPSKSYQILLKIFGIAANAIITVSSAVKQSLLNLKIQSQKINVIYNAVYSLQPKNDEILSEKIQRFKNKYPIIIGVMGTIEKRKGILECLQALQIIQNSCHNYQIGLIIAGVPVDQDHFLYEQRIFKFIDDHHLQEHVLWLGKINNINIFFEKINLFVHYPQGPDPLPTVILEALQHNTPVIASNNGGNPECLNNGEWGTIVTPNKPKKLAEAIVQHNLEKLSDIKYQEVQNYFKHANKEMALLKIYKSLL